MRFAYAFCFCVLLLRFAFAFCFCVLLLRLFLRFAFASGSPPQAFASSAFASLSLCSSLNLRFLGLYSLGFRFLSLRFLSVPLLFKIEGGELLQLVIPFNDLLHMRNIEAVSIIRRNGLGKKGLQLVTRSLRRRSILVPCLPTRPGWRGRPPSISIRLPAYR